MISKRTLLYGLLTLLALVLAACGGGEPGPAGPEGAQGPQGETGPVASAADLTCTACHTEEPIITGKRLQWEESQHGSGEAYVRGTSSSCAGCHSGGGFSDRIAAGLDPDEVEAGDPNPTRQDCRTCHQIHTTYTGADFALETTDPVTLFVSGETFDMGLGNLCANCHQPRSAFPAAVDGQVEITSTHWGPHYGAEAPMLLGVGGAIVEGTPSAHYSMVSDGCVTCHMGDDRNHTWEPDVDNCTTCHTDLDSFDNKGVQTEVAALAAEVLELLEAEGIMHDGHPVVGIYDEAKAAALWNYLFAVEEDTSGGVHNSTYALALLEQAKAAFE